MKGFWWKFPLLRSLSPMRRGFVEAVWMIFLASVLTGYAINIAFSDPAAVSEPLAQIGATLLVAYAVQTGWVVQNSRKRGGDRENWVGMASGIGCCTLVGVFVALCLSPHQESLDLLEGFGFAWAVISIGFLGL
ncbi:MAG TPA: hypothetical protein VIV13_01015, partial [Solirubrobacterales bacterium]